MSTRPKDNYEQIEALEKVLHTLRSANRMDKLVQSQLIVVTEAVQHLLQLEESRASYRREQSEYL